MKKILTMCAAILAAMSLNATVTPMTCAEAAAAAALLTPGTSGTDSVAVTGYITNTDGTISKGQQTFWLDDEKGDTKTFEGYWCYLPQEMVDAGTPLNVGDKVTISGYLLHYKDKYENSTYEMKNGITVVLERAVVKIDTIPATVCEAIEEGESLNDGDVSEEVYVIEDVVATVESTNEEYNTQIFTFECADNGKIMKPYNIAMQGDYCALGDSVRIIGKLKKYGDLVEFTGKGLVTKKGDVKIDTFAVNTTQAYEIGIALENNATSKEVYIVTGYVDSIASEYSEKYGNMSFFMCDDLANPTYDFEAFQITVPADKPAKVGDYVSVTGNILHYYKAATEEKPELHTIEIKKGEYQLIRESALRPVKAGKKAMKTIVNGQFVIKTAEGNINVLGTMVR